MLRAMNRGRVILISLIALQVISCRSGLIVVDEVVKGDENIGDTIKRGTYKEVSRLMEVDLNEEDLFQIRLCRTAGLVDLSTDSTPEYSMVQPRLITE